MKIVNSTFGEFADYVKKGKRKILFWGAGAIGKILIPYLCNQFCLGDFVEAYIDRNESKQGEMVDLFNRKVVIRSPEWLSEENITNNMVVVITNGDFVSSLEQLNKMEQLRDHLCFVAPVMQLAQECRPGNITVSSEVAVIPKKIHYCWFSGNPIPDKFQSCIESWKTYCPDYEIIRWDESNFDVAKYRYTKEAYKAGKWAFIPDVVRLEVLYEYGGFYFDTDVEIIRNLEPLRYQHAFCGREEWGHVNFGGGSGCQRHADMVGELLDFRKKERFFKEKGLLNTEASGYYETIPLLKKGLHIENMTEIIGGMTIYASEYFCPYNYSSGTERITENTFSIHYFNGGWLGTEGAASREKTREKFSEIVDSMGSISLEGIN